MIPGEVMTGEDEIELSAASPRRACTGWSPALAAVIRDRSGTFSPAPKPI